ncbi:MAG: O-antigen ligase family protein [Longimicrobiales bacterium]
MMSPSGGIGLLSVCLFVVLVVNITAIQMYMGPVRLLRPGLLFVVIALLSLAVQPGVAAWKNLRQSWVSKAIFVVFLIACTGVALGISPGWTGRYIMNVYSRNLLIFFLFILAIRNVRNLAFLMWAFVVSAGIVVVLSQTVLTMEVTRDGLARLNGGQTHYDANDLGMIMVMALPLAMLFFFTAKGITKILSGLTLLGIPVTIALTGSRGAFLGLVAVAIPILFALNRIAVFKRILVLAVAVAGLWFSAPPGYWEQMATLTNVKEDENFTAEYGRKQLALRGFGYMIRHPIAGVGVGNFGRAEITLSALAKKRLEENLGVPLNPAHNTYVQVGSEMGIFAFIIWLALIGSGIVGLWRLRRRLPSSWDWESAERRFLRQCCLFLPISFLGFAVTSAFLSHAYTLIAYIIFAFLAGIHLLVRQELNNDLRKPVGTQTVTPPLTRPGRRAQLPIRVRNVAHPAQGQVSRRLRYR